MCLQENIFRYRYFSIRCPNPSHSHIDTHPPILPRPTTHRSPTSPLSHALPPHATVPHPIHTTTTTPSPPHHNYPSHPQPTQPQPTPTRPHKTPPPLQNNLRHLDSIILFDFSNRIDCTNHYIPEPFRNTGVNLPTIEKLRPCRQNKLGNLSKYFAHNNLNIRRSCD